MGTRDRFELSVRWHAKQTFELTRSCCFVNGANSCFSFTWQSASGNERKVMMFVVIADVESDPVERTVVGVGLKAFAEHVVLRDEVTGNWVKAHRHKGPTHQVEQYFSPCKNKDIQYVSSFCK